MHDPTFTIDVELLHGAMEFHPDFVHGSDKSLVFFVFDHLGGVPTGAPTKQVGDD